MRRLYSALLYLIAPLVIVRLWLKGRRNPAYRRRWRERFGALPDPGPSPVIWIHAVSVGEAQAAQPLIRRLLADYPEHRVLVSTTTPTGLDQVTRLFGDTVLHRYFPFDLPGIVNRYLDRVRPVILIVMETEIWPNLLAGCAERRIPVALVNARLSARSAGGYERVRPLVAEALSRFSRIAVQTPRDGERFAALGAPAERIVETGNLKFDIRLPASISEQSEVLRLSWGLDRPVWIAASTHEGEEKKVLAAHARVLERYPQALLVLVPRHPERFDAVADLVRRENYRFARRSSGVGDPDIQVFLGDTMGELVVFFGAADVAFVGGSLVGVGGHNVLEPAALGVPTVFGPHMFNFAVISELFTEEGAAVQVADENALAETVMRWFGDPGERTGVGEAGRRVGDANRGALDRTLREIHALLPPGGERAE